MIYTDDYLEDMEERALANPLSAQNSILELLTAYRSVRDALLQTQDNYFKISDELYTLLSE